MARLGVRELGSSFLRWFYNIFNPFAANLFGLDIRGRRLKDANQGVLNFNPRPQG